MGCGRRLCCMNGGLAEISSKSLIAFSGEVDSPQVAPLYRSPLPAPANDMSESSRVASGTLAHIQVASVRRTRTHSEAHSRGVAPCCVGARRALAGCTHAARYGV